MAEVVVPAALAAAGEIFSASKKAGASRQASEASSTAQREALALQEKQLEWERQRYAEEQRRIDEDAAREEARRRPYRQSALSVLGGWFDGLDTSMPPPMKFPSTSPRTLTDFTGFEIGNTPRINPTPPIVAPRGLTRYY